MHDLQKTAVRRAMERSGPYMGVPRVNLRWIGLENPANPCHISAAGGRDQIVASIHHCLLDVGAL
jgi:hypothetical protein